MNTVDPWSAHVGQGFNVHITCQKLRLEAPHLAGGRSLSFDGLATNNPPHGRVTSETLGVVYIFVTAKASKHRLAKLTGHAVPSVLAGTAVVENILDNFGQAKRIVKFSIGEQTGVRSNLGTMEFKLQAVVKIDPQRGLSAFTCRVMRGAPVLMCVLHWFL